MVEKLRAVIDSYPDRLLIGEIYLPVERLMTYYGANDDGGHRPFNCQLIQWPWRVDAIGAPSDEDEAALPEGGWPNWVLSNHDQPRIAARVGQAQARIAAMLLLTLRGTPTLYYGDEIGIADIDMSEEQVLDPAARNEPGVSFNRDRSRSPMQWSADIFAGFSQSEPWLPLTRDWRQRNVAAQSADPASLLNLYRALLRLRSSESALQTGRFARVAAQENILAYRRGATIGVMLNLTAETVPLELPAGWNVQQVLLSARAGGALEALPPVLEADEGLILRLEGSDG